MISFHAIASLMSALAHRDADTTTHSRRVANLCVATAKGLMSEHHGYLLETAARLHDIGKVGVPDSVLRKPEPLTEHEWEIMGSRDRLGVEIIMATTRPPLVSEIVRTHHAWYGGIPLDARILGIADAYDAMTSNRVYRKGCPATPRSPRSRAVRAFNSTHPWSLIS